MKYIKTLKIDIDKKNFEVIPSVQYDNNTRFLHIQLLNNSVPFNITGCSAILSGVKEDGNPIFNSCDIINSEIGFIQAELTEQMNAIPGYIDCEIKIYDGEGVLTSKKFTIKVTASQTSRAVESTGEFKALTDALSKVNNINNKMDKGESISPAQIDKNKGKFDQTYFTDEFLQQMAGNTPVNTTPADRSITSEKYAEKSIRDIHVDFIEHGKNYFDNTRISPKGWYMQYTDGRPVQNQYVTELCYSDYMKVSPNDVMLVNKWIHSYCIFDMDRGFVTGKTSGTNTTKIQIPENGEYLVINPYHREAILETIQVEQGDNFTVYEPYEIKVKNQKVDKIVEDLIPKVEEIKHVKSKVNSLDISLKESFECSENVLGEEFKAFEGFGYETSTFSGWASCIGKPKRFNSLKFKVRGRNNNTSNITKIKLMLLKNEKLILEQIVDVNIEPNTIETIIWELPEVIENMENDYFQFSFQCNALCDLGKAGTISNGEYSITRYSTGGQFMSYENMTKMTNFESGGGAIIWTEIGINSLHLEIKREDFKKHLNENINIGAYGNSLELYNKFEVEQGNEYSGESHATSTFSGWGGHIGSYELIKSLKFEVKNRDTKPTTKVKVFLTDFNKDGAILAESIIDVNIPAGEIGEVIWEFDTPFNNQECKKLFLSYQCNTLITKISSKLPENADDINYGWNTYATNGDLNIYPHQFSQVYGETGGTNTIWCEIGEFIKAYKPSKILMEEIKENISSLDNIRVVLPDKITAVVGDTIQLFYRGFIEAVNPYNFDIRIFCSKGKQYPRYFEYKPEASDVGDYTLKFKIYNNSGKLITENETILNVVQANEEPNIEKNILCVGDSLTSGGIWCEEARRRLCDTGGSPIGHGKSNINFIGTKENNNGCRWEGYGGWTWDSYLNKPNITTSDIWIYCNHDKTSEDQHSIWQDNNGSKWSLETIESGKLKFTRYQGHNMQPPSGPSILIHVQNAVNTANINFTDCKVADGNPFWDFTTDRVNFKKYCETNGFDGIDYVYTLLTWNGGRVDKWDIDSNKNVIVSAKKFIDRLHEDYPNAKVRIMGIQLPSLNGGCGANYGATGGYSETYGLVRGVFGLNLAYQELANDIRYSEFVEFINVSGSFDSEYNMPYSVVPVNNRCEITEMRGTNGVHPSNGGYLQIGDIAYRNMVKDLLN